MKSLLISLLLAAGLFGVLDSLWFALFMKKFAIAKIGDHLRLRQGNIDVQMFCTFAAYTLMVVAAVAFLRPSIAPENSILTVVGKGFLFGVCIFGIFDFTNGALLKNYPFSFIIVDTLWGGLMYAVVAVSFSLFVAK